MAKRLSFGQATRKRLSDITNYQPQQKLPPVLDQILPLNASSAKEQIDHLLKENEGLLKLIADKSKVIEMNGIELQKLRIALQKTQLQNWNLAQSNSHMMAELNLGKKKLKELQHQLTCKDALFKTMNSELQAMRETNDQKCESKVNDQKCETKVKDQENARTNRQNSYRRTRPVRSQSIGNMTTDQASEEEIVENKRRRVRRRHSAMFTTQCNELNEDLFEIKDLKMHEDEQKHNKCRPKPEPKDSQRMSFGRPSRKAAEKINSYKEIPLNVKMRRPE